MCAGLSLVGVVEGDLRGDFQFTVVAIGAISSQSGEVVESDIGVAQAACRDLVELILGGGDCSCVNRVWFRLDSRVHDLNGAYFAHVLLVLIQSITH